MQAASPCIHARIPMLRSSAFATFRTRSYRFQWPADLLTSCAFEMEVIILGWYILVETGSVFWLTLFGALQYGGTLVSPVLGVLSDRIGPRNLLTGMRLIYTTIATALMVLAFTGGLTPGVVLMLVAVMGLVRPSDPGLRQALIADTIPPDRWPGAIGMSRITSDLARVAGALAGAGIVLMLGMGVAYIAIAVFYALAALLTSQADSAQRRGAREEQAVAPGVPRRVTGWTDLCDGIAYIRSKPSLIAIIWLALLFNFTAFPLTNGLLPYVARDVYGVDQSGLGYLVASIACGAMVGGLLAGGAGAGVRLARLMVVSGVVWHLLLLVFAQMEVWHLGMAVLFVNGVAQSLTMISLTVVLVREAGDRFRGRVMGVRMMAIYSLPVGLLFAGWLIDEIGYSGTATLYATFGLVSIIFIAVRWRADMWASAR